MKYVIVIAVARRFAAGEVQRIVDLVTEEAVPKGVKVTYDPKYGNSHYATLQVQTRDEVSGGVVDDF
jgi:hypothetical protein